MAPPLEIETTTTDTMLPSSFLAYYDMKSIVGDIFGEYTCSWEKSNGTLYAGSKGIYFLGSFFLFERKLILEWEQVRLVQKTDQGIEVVCKNEASHSFYGTQSPDRFWALLLSLHNDALLDLKRRRGGTNYKRRNSDPWKSPQHVHGLISAAGTDTNNRDAGVPMQLAADDKNPGVTATDSVKATSRKAKSSADIEKIVGWTQMDPVACKMDQIPGQLYAGENGLLFSGKRFFWETRSLAIRWQDIVRIQILDDKNSPTTIAIYDSRDNPLTTFSSILNVRAVWASLVALHNEKLRKADSPRHRTHRRMNSDPLRESKAMIDVDYIMDSDDSKRTETISENAETMEEQWETAKKEGQMKTVIVDNLTLNCNLDRFVSLFLQDEANYSLARYLEGRGDTSLTASRWKKVNDIESTRTITYTHPMNIPLAPPQADASKEQKCMRYGTYGVIIETKTIVRDVPMADCFYVADRLVVKPESDGKVKLKMEFDITFVKSTMFKGIISKTTTSELTSYLNDFAAYISQSMEGEAPPVVDEVIVVKQKAERIPVADSNHVLTICLVAILSLQVWILYDLRSIKSTLRSLHR